MKQRTSNECLSAALTLLVKHNICDEKEVSNTIKEGYTSLFDYINDKYKEWHESEKVSK